MSETVCVTVERLRWLEWVNQGHVCRVCLNSQEQGHKDTCWLGNAISSPARLAAWRKTLKAHDRVRLCGIPEYWASIRSVHSDGMAQIIVHEPDGMTLSMLRYLSELMPAEGE